MNIYEIAELANVSIATVSRVINDSPLVSEKTKQRVRAVMKANNYTPNVFARGLGLNSMKTIGFICPDVADNYMARAVAYLEKDLRDYGYDSERVNYIREAAKHIPVFLINGYVRGENVYCALCTDYEATYSTIIELIRAGRKRILFLSDSHSYSANQKLRAYKAALQWANIPIREELIMYMKNRIDLARDLLLDILDLDIDAVFATEDGLAAGALKYAKRRNIAVPEQLNIIGYNNSELSVCCDPELSSIENRVDRLCKIVIDSLKLCLKKQAVSDKVYAKGYLIRRSTTNF